MLSKKGQKLIFLINCLILVMFAIFIISEQKHGYFLNVALLAFILSLITYTTDAIEYTNGALWGLTFWSFFHVIGNFIQYNGFILYKWILIPITEDFLRYDQVVHAVGFAFATIVLYEVLKPALKKKHDHWVALGLAIFLMGIGMGSINEVIEFFGVYLYNFPVGGYINTSLDMVANMVGAFVALVYIYYNEH